jgi:NADH:ubiquinone oxidoreductase subunit K
MLPVTHYLYLALLLFSIGLGGALLRRSLTAVLLAIQLMLAAVVLCFCAYARLRADPTGQIAALLVVLVGLCELGVVVAVTLRSLRMEAEQVDEGSKGTSLLEDWPHMGEGGV